MSQSPKAAVREEMRRRLSGLSAEQRRDASERIRTVIIGRPEWKTASVVGLYLSLPDEPETRDLIRAAWDQGKKVALPKTDIRQGLTWWEIPPGTLPSMETLWEPLPEKHAAVALSSIGGFCVPGRAFDPRGTRLGRGGGHYDRALVQRARQSWVMGLFFAVQEAEILPWEPHDVRLARVITEHGWRELA